jgi:hypothetical protein
MPGWSAGSGAAMEMVIGSDDLILSAGTPILPKTFPVFSGRLHHFDIVTNSS